MSFIDDATLTSYVKDQLKRSSSALLASDWASKITQANTRAYYDILAAFLIRGYTKAQVDTWDRGAEFQTDLGAFYALTNGAVVFPDGFDDKPLQVLDRRKELWGDKDTPKTPLMASGAYVDPAGTRGQPNWGPMYDQDQAFGNFDPQDSRLGKITRL